MKTTKKQEPIEVLIGMFALGSAVFAVVMVVITFWKGYLDIAIPMLIWAGLLVTSVLAFQYVILARRRSSVNFR